MIVELVPEFPPADTGGGVTCHVEYSPRPLYRVKVSLRARNADGHEAYARERELVVEPGSAREFARFSALLEELLATVEHWSDLEVQVPHAGIALSQPWPSLL